MYKYKDYNYSLEEVQDAADKENLSIDEYIKEFNIQKTDPDPDEEGKEAPSQEIESATVEESIALEPTVTDSKPVTISSDLPKVKTGTVADTEYISPAITSEESQKIIDNFNKVSNVDAEFENKKATAEKINRFKKDQFKTAEKEEYNLYKQTGEIQPVVLEKSDIDQKISNNKRNFMEDIAQDKRVQLLNQEVQLRDSLVNTTNELKLKINDNVNAINNIFLQYEESIKQGIPYSVDEYNIAKQKSQELMKSTKQMESDLLRDYAILNKKNEFIDSFKRSYGNIDQLENVLKTTATDMALGLAVPLDMLKSEEGKEKSYTKDLLNYRQKLQKESAEGLPKAIPVESISSFKDLVNWGSDSFVNFVPSGVMAFTGPAAPYLFGASGFGSRIAQFELESLEAKNQLPKLQELYSKSDDPLEKAEIQKEINKYNKALNVSDLKKLAVSGIYGVAEVGTEMLTTVRLVKDLKSANTLFYKEGFAPAFKQAIKDIPLGGALEGGGEGLNNIIGNVADITILKEDKNAFDGVTESAAQGFFIGNGFKVANAGSLVKAYAYDVITDKQNKQEIESILKEINNLSNAFTEDTDINTKAEAARVIRSKIKEIGLNQDFTASQFLKLSEADQKAVFEADRQSKKVNERWKKIANSNLDETSKDLIRKDLELEFNSYQDKKISLLRKSNVNTELQQPKGLQEGDFYRGYKIHQVNDASVKRNNSLNKLANKVVNVLSSEAETISDFINSDETLLTLNDGSVITKEDAQQINQIWESGSDGGFDRISKNQYTIIERAAVNNPSTALHEYFHAMAAEKGFTKEQYNKIKDDYIKLLKAKKENGELTEKQYNEIFSRLSLYDGTTAQAEELINLTADAVNLQIIKETDFNFLQRFANNVKSIVGSIIGKDEADNFNINTAEDAWNMVQTFSKDVLSSAPQKQIIGTQPEEEDKAVKEAETIIKESKSEKASQSLLERLNTMIPANIKTKEQFDEWIRDSKNYGEKEVAIMNNYVNSLVRDKKLTKEQADIIIDELPFRVLNFDPAATRADNTVVGPQGFGERIFSDVQFAKRTANKALFEASERKSRESRREDREDGFETLAISETEVEVTETKPTERLIETKNKFLSPEGRTGFEENVASRIDELAPDEFTFKKLPNWGKEDLAKELNIPIKKFEGSSNFTQAELGRLLTWIETNVSDIRRALPGAAVLEGASVPESLIGTATGVPNNLLKNINLYERLARGTKDAGLVPYRKLKGIDNSSILKAVGIIDGRQTAGPRDKAAQTAKGIFNMMAKVMTNQEIRKQLQAKPRPDITTKETESARAGGVESRLLFSKPLSKVFGLSANEAFSFSNISDINSGRIELKDLSSAMIKDIGIQGWIDIIDPVVSRQYKIGDKQLLDNKIGFEALELTEEEFNKNKNILLERSTIDGKKRYNQFLTRGRKDYYENILSNAINKEVKWIPRKGVEINGTIYKTPIVPKQTPEGFVNKKAWNASLPERIKFAENQRKGFKKIIQKLTNTYQNSNKSKKDKAKVGMVLNTFNSNINGLIRTAATPGLEFRVEKLNKDSDYRYEHTQPASETLRQLAKIIIGDKNAQTYEEIMQNFRVAIIPKIYDDIINKVRFDGKLLRSTAPLDENKNLQKPVESTKPTRYEAAAKAIANAGLAPLILTDAIVPSGKAQVKLSKSKSKAAVKNNLELPKSQRLPKGSTNEQVLAKMQELDDQANEARIKYSKSQNLDEAFNDIIEAKTGIETYKRFSPAKAAVRGASKGKFNFFIPPSAEDFTGLLYKTLAKGKLGDRQMQWYKDNLLDPYARAMNDISAARVAMFEDYKALKNDLEIIPKDLKKKSVDEYTREQAVRVYIWNNQGNNVPGLFKTDQKDLVNYVNNDTELKLFAEQLIAIQKNDEYSAPKEGWLAGSITTDLLEGVNSIKRKKYLEQWQNNADEIFSDVNMNKLEAAFGKPYKKALENILQRMKTGRNKPFTSDSLAGRVTDWLNNSVGAIMFFNTRSAVLQTISSINFVNWSDNNIYEAGKAFANQPQYWKDFKLLFNSDFLKERRGGLRFNVSESEIADAAKKGGARGVISKILQAGFLPTQMADSFAIASGGATFYRNRVKSYIKEGLTEAQAQEKAFLDFREIAEESQQSSRPDRISAQQAGPLGRTILAFANTPAQYARLTKKAASDLINGRGDAKTNISKLLYYGAVQNLIFNTLQQAAFAIAFGDDDEDEKKKEEKYISVANGMADGLLRGIGVGGAVIATLKNALIKIIKESEKKRPDYAETTVMQLLGISPPIQSKAQKVRSALKSYEWNKNEMKEKGFSLDNPAYLAGANVISASTNVPLDRVIKKVDNVRAATRDDISKLERMMLLAGWSDWQLGIQPERKPKKKKKTRSSGRGTSRSNNRSSNRR